MCSSSCNSPNSSLLFARNDKLKMLRFFRYRGAPRIKNHILNYSCKQDNCSYVFSFSSLLFARNDKLKMLRFFRYRGALRIKNHFLNYFCKQNNCSYVFSFSSLLFARNDKLKMLRFFRYRGAPRMKNHILNYSCKQIHVCRLLPQGIYVLRIVDIISSIMFADNVFI